MLAFIVGLALMTSAPVVVEKVEQLNDRESVVDLERYENEMAKEYGIKETKRLRMGEVYNYPNQSKKVGGLRK